MIDARPRAVVQACRRLAHRYTDLLPVHRYASHWSCSFLTSQLLPARKLLVLHLTLYTARDRSTSIYTYVTHGSATGVTRHTHDTHDQWWWLPPTVCPEGAPGMLHRPASSIEMDFFFHYDNSLLPISW